jgi:hypothetical protein
MSIIPQNRTRNDYFYLEIVLRYFRTYLKLKKQLEESNFPSIEGKIEAILKNMDQENVKNMKELESFANDPMFGIFYQLKICATVTIVFSALCLESLINDYAIIKTSASYFKNYLDKLDTVSKWIIIPKIVTGKSISTDGKAFELLKGIFKARNKLVHPKSRTFKNIEEPMAETIELLIKNVPMSVIAIKESTKALYEIDSTFEYLEYYRSIWGEKNIENYSILETLMYSMINRIPKI